MAPGEPEPTTEISIPLADQVRTGIARGMAHLSATLGPFRYQYEIDMGAAIEAEFLMKPASDDSYRADEPDRIHLTIHGARGVTRNITAAIKMETSDPDFANERDFPRSVVVREIRDVRRVTLLDGTEVSKVLVIGQHPYRTPKGDPNFHPRVLSDELHIVKRLDNPPEHNSKPITIDVAWDGYEEDAYEETPNAVFYQKSPDDGTWRKTYVLQEVKGGKTVLRFPINEYGDRVHNLDVTDEESASINSILMRQSELGVSDGSLIGLIGEEITADSAYAEQLTSAQASREQERKQERKQEEDAYEYVGADEPE